MLVQLGKAAGLCRQWKGGMGKGSQGAVRCWVAGATPFSHKARPAGQAGVTDTVMEAEQSMEALNTLLTCTCVSRTCGTCARHRLKGSVPEPILAAQWAKHVALPCAWRSCVPFCLMQLHHTN